MSYWEMSFDGLPERLSDVRQYVLKTLGDVPGVDDVVLVSSELAANAIRHSVSGAPGGSFTLHLAESREAWHLRIDDMGGPSTPKPGHPDDNDEAGRGLPMVTALARAWGVVGDRNGRAVWAEVAFPAVDAAAKSRKGNVARVREEPLYRDVSRRDGIGMTAASGGSMCGPRSTSTGSAVVTESKSLSAEVWKR
ncbi:ATP-binding protein [Catenulispora sp. NL8]|uniref:ATP-binding protein n=1 Tax=Catenulispora pinistramenti TaxID=2705254 RepID=A0ABS5KH93_9ACTN|nr:ATP-binding protein [Catenulispora pinistramenti]MBS2545407.1 ATP-binding protein [Catenulispora pinistramenti]